MQLTTVVTLFTVLAGVVSAGSRGSPSYGGNNGNNGGNGGQFTGGYGTDSDLTDQEIEAVLAAHNKYRSGCGLKPVNYSKRVASVAQQWARANPGGCRKMQHNKNRQGLGENIACQTGGGNKIQQLTDMISRWGDEYKNCRGGTAGCSFVGGSSTQGATGHFTQMVDATCQEVGCAWKDGFVVCNYSPAGNMQGQEHKNICPNGFKGYGSGAGGIISDGGSGGTSPVTPPADTYAPVNNNSGNNGGNTNYGGNNNNNYGGHNSGNNGGHRGGNVRYYTKTLSKPVSFNNGGFIPVRDNSGSGNTRPTTSYGGRNNNSGSGNTRPSQSYGGNSNDSGSGSGGRSYGSTNNNSGGQADKDCDESKKAKKL